ncbi:tetratricopeptide repeat protein [Alteromonas halophila]|nr:tetratricopeptide repeat protein [Alteromonas halophila]
MIKKMLLLPLLTAAFYTTAEPVKMGECDTSECREYFKDYKRYAKSHIDASSMVGDMYLNGYGTDVDKEKALDYYKKAARWGSVLGRYKMGLLMLQHGEQEEREEGLVHLSDAAKRDHPTAIYFMGEVLSTDKYGLKDLERADEWIARSIKEQNHNVIYTLGRLSDEGELTEANLPATIAAIKRAPDSMIPGQSPETLETYRLPPPDERYEVITVNGPNLAEVLDYGLKLFKAAPSDIHKKTTGTRIRGRDCEDVFSCSTVPVANWQRYMAYQFHTPFEVELFNSRF